MPAHIACAGVVLVCAPRTRRACAALLSESLCVRGVCPGVCAAGTLLRAFARKEVKHTCLWGSRPLPHITFQWPHTFSENIMMETGRSLTSFVLNCVYFYSRCVEVSIYVCVEFSMFVSKFVSNACRCMYAC